MSVNGVKNCSVSNCVNSNIIAARKRHYLPTIDKKPKFIYFCEDHFDPAKEETELDVSPKSEVIVPKADSNRSVYSNRKRKQNIVRWRPQRTKFEDEGQTYTLNEQDLSNETNDDTVVNIQFEFEIARPEDYENEKSGSIEQPDDNDCIITEVPSTNVIDLSDDDEGGKDDSNKMIEVILCNEIEPEDAQTTREFAINTWNYDEFNGFESQEVEKQLHVNFCVLKDSENDAIHTIDLTEETTENTNMEIGESVQSIPKITSVQTIDLTEPVPSEDESEDTNNAVLEKVIRDFSNKYPGTLKSISRNGENNQLEIELCKNGLFKTEDEFKLYIMKVANLIQDSQLEGVDINDPLGDITQENVINEPTPEIRVKDIKTMQAVGSSCVILNKDFLPKQPDILNYSRPATKIVNGQSGRLNEVSPSSPQDTQTVKGSKLVNNTEIVNDSNVSHDHEPPPKQQAALKYYLPAKMINSQYVNRLNENSSPSSNKSETLNDSKLTKNTQIVSNYNASQILKKSKSYLGVSKTTFQTIENLLKNRFKNKSVLILLLRKIKLNESFSMLSDVLCPNKKDVISIYEEVLPELSRALQIFLRWPGRCSDTVAVVGVFEIEIKKPYSFLEQSMTFCSQRQRYLVKFLISCTSSGYINHVSMPFYYIQDNIFKKCLESIPTNCSVAVHTSLLNFIGDLSNSKRIKTFDTYSNAERNCIQSVFDRMRRFSLLNGTMDRNYFRLLHHTVSVVACLCNMEEK